ncbi:MAG: BrnT family toxin [Betaproteobacteria bacterium]|nr:BrnT family toxin [Betaproteobacteria bacterium]
MIDWAQIAGFDRDKGNERKNEKHGVSMSEAEQVFFNAPLLLLEDAAHSQSRAFTPSDKTDADRALHITFTLRQSGQMIRVISARDMHRKERAIYEQAN